MVWEWQTEKDNLQLNPIPEHTWLDYYQKLWTQQVKDNTMERKLEQWAENCVDLITMEELETTIKTLKPKNLQAQTGSIMSSTDMHQKDFTYIFEFSKCLLGLWGHPRIPLKSYL